MIIIEPYAGLANRMRAMDSAIALSEVSGDDLYLVWYRTELLNCKFDDLFEIPRCFKKIYELKKLKIITRMQRRIAKSLINLVGNYVEQSGIEDLLKQQFRFTNLTTNRVTYLRTWSRFMNSDKPPYKDFSPVQSLQEIIDDQTRHFEKVVGVHIRRRDQIISVENSPTYKFLELMKVEIQDNPDVRFFVATDSPAEEEILRSEFPGRIQIYEKKSLDRNNPMAIQDALVDLFCLSRCQKVIGSYWSSFSNVACEIGQIESVIAYASPN